MGKYNIAWMEDPAPWHPQEHLRKFAQNSCVPLCTGEDIYLAENFAGILASRRRRHGTVSEVKDELNRYHDCRPKPTKNKLPQKKLPFLPHHKNGTQP